MAYFCVKLVECSRLVSYGLWNVEDRELGHNFKSFIINLLELFLLFIYQIERFTDNSFYFNILSQEFQQFAVRGITSPVSNPWQRYEHFR